MSKPQFWTLSLVGGVCALLLLSPIILGWSVQNFGISRTPGTNAAASAAPAPAPGATQRK